MRWDKTFGCWKKKQKQECVQSGFKCTVVSRITYPEVLSWDKSALATAKTLMVTKAYSYHCDSRHCITFNRKHTSVRSVERFISLHIPLVTALTSQVKTGSQERLFMEGFRAMWEEMGNRDIFIHLTSTRGQWDIVNVMEWKSLMWSNKFICILYEEPVSSTQLIKTLSVKKSLF